MTEHDFLVGHTGREIAFLFPRGRVSCLYEPKKRKEEELRPVPLSFDDSENSGLSGPRADEERAQYSAAQY